MLNPLYLIQRVESGLFYKLSRGGSVHWVLRQKDASPLACYEIAQEVAGRLGCETRVVRASFHEAQRRLPS